MQAITLGVCIEMVVCQIPLLPGQLLPSFLHMYISVFLCLMADDQYYLFIIMNIVSVMVLGNPGNIELKVHKQAFLCRP